MPATGKDHARVNLSIWGDDDWLDLTPPAQHLYLVLWTSPSLSYCGAGDWKPAKIAERSKGWTTHAIETAASELSHRLFLLIDVNTEEFLLRSWVKHDGLWKQPNMAVSMANARADLASRALRGVVVHEVQKIRRENPDMGGWKRDALVDLLAQKSVDPASIPPFNPSGNPPPDPGSDPSVNPYGRVGVDPSVDPGPTPSPSPAPFSFSPSPSGGYVSTEGHQANIPDDPPPMLCTEHINNPTTRPCGACGEARRTRERWDDAQRLSLVQAGRDERMARAQQIRYEIDACDLCDNTGYRNGRVCDHDPDSENRAARGLALVREQLERKANHA